MIKFSSGLSKAVKIDAIKKKIDELQREIKDLEKPKPDAKLYIFGGDIPKNIIHAFAIKDKVEKLAIIDMFGDNWLNGFSGDGEWARSGTAAWFIFADKDKAVFGSAANMFKDRDLPWSAAALTDVYEGQPISVANFKISFS